ncbi:MAG: NAD(P)/FAD-dependent oxidoreductase [Bacillota bacterium]
MRVVKADLAVVGAGPAGLTAARAAAERGLRVIVVDEYHRPGGRLLGQLHEERGPNGSPRWWKGIEVAQRLVAEATRAGVQIMTGVQVWGLTPGWTLSLHGGDCDAISSRVLLLATGAGERPLPVPGWTLPGVITVGAAQIFANVHRVRPGDRVLLCGVDPLSLTVARELSMAGAEVLGVVLPPAGPLSGDRAHPARVIASLSRMAHLAPSPLLRLAGRLFPGEGGARLGARLYPRSGVKAWGVPLLLRQALVRIEGESEVTGAVLTDIDAEGEPIPGRERRVTLDCVALSGGLSPLAELAAAAGCQMVQSGLGGLVPLHSPTMETEREGLLVAGNITGVEGAPVAMAQGQIAGITACRLLGAVTGTEHDRLMDDAVATLRAVREGAAIQFYPGTAEARLQLAARWSGRLIAER